MRKEEPMTIINRDKIASSFKKDSPEYGYVNSYLTELLTNWRETEQAITRTAALIVGLCVAFELIFSKKASASTFFGVAITSTNVFQVCIPVIIAYLYYALTYSFMESQVFYDTYDGILEKVYPGLYEAGGECQLYPANSITASIDRVTHSIDAKSKGRGLAEITGYIRPAVITIGAPAFLLAAYSQLFVRYGLTDSILWGSLAISAILLLAGIINQVVFSSNINK
jgi:hypothetical protein